MTDVFGAGDGRESGLRNVGFPAAPSYERLRDNGGTR